MKVVILSGGKGRRLAPYTMIFPKPLVPIDDKPILEIIIKQLAQYGYKDVIMAVGHLSELIETYFGDGSKYGVNIEYSAEKQPLGTAGPLCLVKDKLDGTFILMNGDILTDLNFEKLVEFHKSSNASATISLTSRKVDLNYGIVEMDENRNLSGWSEKPTMDYFVSMGIYVLEPEAIELIPENQAFDLPNLILELMKNNKIVKGYPYDGYWLDIGRPEDNEKALNEYESLNLNID
jgi:NDP-sugar pyrophosphorylase family protein